MGNYTPLTIFGIVAVGFFSRRSNRDTGVIKVSAGSLDACHVS